MPEILLIGGSVGGGICRVGIATHDVVRVTATDACRLHPAVGGEVCGAEGEALHARRRGADRFDVGNTPRRLEDRMHEDRSIEVCLRFELGEEAIHVVDVFGPLDLRDHDDVELVADLRHQRGDVVETPRRIEAVDPAPQLGVAHVDGAGDLDEAGSSGLLVGHRYRVLEVAEEDVDGGDDIRQLGDDLVDLWRKEVDDATRPEGNLPQGRRERRPRGV